MLVQLNGIRIDDLQADYFGPQIIVDYGKKAGTTIRIPLGVDDQMVVNTEKTMVTEVRASHVYGVIYPSEPVANEGL
jgi:hypothetical protein